MTAREEILSRIRAALADQPQPPPIERNYRTSGRSWDFGSPDSASVDSASTDDAGPDSSATLLDLLVDRLVDYKATVHHATGETAAAVIAAALSERGVNLVVVPDGFPAALLGSVDPASIIRDEPRLTAAQLDVIDGVLTTSTVSIAETGTIVLDAGPGQGRRILSLVPDYHLCVVQATDVVRGVPEAITRLSPENSTAPNPETSKPPGRFGGRPLTWISGPSATSDIELQRVEGVHGPRTLAVVLITAPYLPFMIS